MPRKRRDRATPPKPERTGRENTPDGKLPDRRSGEDEVIAERRVKAFDLRKTGASYREIAKQLEVSVQTAYADVNAELYDLRQQTKADAEYVKDLELQRLDELTVAVWPVAMKGDEKGVNAAIKIMERRAKLLGLDEQTGEVGVPAEQIYTYTRRVVTLVLSTFTNKDEVARFLEGLRQLVGRAKPIDVIASSTTE